MKKILIVNSNLHIGGVQRALVNLLKCIHSKYDITLALFNTEGELLKEVPHNVKILQINSDYRFLGLSKYDVENEFFLKIKRNIYAAITKIFGRDMAISLMTIGQKKLSGFDVAISYIHNGSNNVFYGGCNDFVLNHVETSKKIAFLHCDYNKCGANTLTNKDKYIQFDVIAACSEGCRHEFLKAIPELSDKTKVVYNCQDFGTIEIKANELQVKFSKEKVNIITIARLGKEKGVPRAIEALAKSHVDKKKWHYYIIGDGVEKNTVEEKIKTYDLEKQVTLLGELENPYSYLKEADLLLISSYSEAAPMVIGEAAYLGIPVLSTATSSAKEMIVDTGLGWVCDNSIEGLSHMLSKLLINETLLEEKHNTIVNQEHNNRRAVKQFDEIVMD